MSRRNSKEEKARRRLENAWKKDRYVPIPTPEEYIKHIGFVPNDPFFYNSAIAGDLNGQDFAFRTKTQLLDYVETQDFFLKKVGTKSGDTCIEISCYYIPEEENCFANKEEVEEEVGYDQKTIERWKREQNIPEETELGEGDTAFFDMNKAEKEIRQSLYLVRHRYIDKNICKNEADIKRRNPCFHNINTLWVPLEEIKNLPDKRGFTDDEKVYFAKFYESIQPLDEEELERTLSLSSPSLIERAYETNDEGEVIIEEFFNKEGISIGFQPKKKRESWLRTFIPFPVVPDKKGLRIGGAPDTVNLMTGEVS